MSEKHPTVTRDPRFEAGRSLVCRGLAKEGAIEIFATLVEECRAKHGESSIETAPVYYEYGNALLRAALADEEAADDVPSSLVGISAATVREAAADAAEERLGKPSAVISSGEASEAVAKAEPQESDNTKDVVKEAVKKEGTGESSDENSGNDLQLSLELMENTFSILEEYQSQDQELYRVWVQEQLPRVLTGIADTLVSLERHADAADAYSRAMVLRQQNLEALPKGESLERLQAQRRVCEATLLIAETLLACPPEEDVITTESSSLIVKADERVEYARGYYDKAREELQDTVYLLGRLTSQTIDLGTEKEDVCFIATMIMGVGETLAAIDEEAAQHGSGPAKKAKTT